MALQSDTDALYSEIGQIVDLRRCAAQINRDLHFCGDSFHIGFGTDAGEEHGIDTGFFIRFRPGDAVFDTVDADRTGTPGDGEAFI